jgi:hypothetical protein
MRKHACWASFGVWAAVLGGCGERDPALTEGFDVMDPAAIDDHVVVIDRNRERAHLIDVSSGEGAGMSAFALPAGPRVALQRRGRSSELLVLGAGRVDDGDRPAEAPSLAVLGGDGVDRIYELGARFNAIRQSEDGRRAFLYYDESARDQVESLLFNASEVSVVSLDESPSANNPVRRTLLSLGDVPRQIAFSPPMLVAGEERELAVITFDSEVAIWDLTHIERPAFTIELSQDVSGSIGLQQVLFGVDEAAVYLRGSGSDSVFRIHLSPSTSETTNDFNPSVNPLGAGSRPADMALYDEPGTLDGRSPRRLLVVSGQEPTAVVVDGASSRVTTVPLPASATRIHRFAGRKTGDPTIEERALLYQPGSSSVIFLDLEGLEESGSRKVEALGLRGAYGAVVPVTETLVLLIHQQTGLSLLDLEQRAVQPIQSSVQLLEAVSAHDKLWVAPAGGHRVAFLDLEGFRPDEVRLDAPVHRVVAVPSSTRPRFAVTHASGMGYMTVLDGLDPAALSQAFSVKGYLVDGLLGGRP